MYLVGASCRMQTKQWQDQQGQTRYTTEVRAQRVRGWDKREGAQGNEQQLSNGSYEQPPFPSEASNMDDLPF